MSMFQRLTLSALAFVMAFGVAAVSASAEMYQQQSQTASQKSSFSYNCAGSGCSGLGEIKTSNKLEQTQSQRIGSFRYRTRVHDWDDNNSWRYNRNRDTSGTVTLDWDHRGGTCHVRYTEASARNYKYSTSTSCDNGFITIGGVQTGVKYRFQVQKDNEGWSQPVVSTAI